MAPQCFVVAFALAAVFAVASQGQLASAASANLTAEQRQQLQQLRDIIARALRTVNGTKKDSAIDSELLEARRAWNSSGFVIVHWWHPRPLLAGGIVSGFLILTLLVLLAFFCSPLCVCIRSRHRSPSSEGKPMVTSSEDLTFKELPMVYTEPFGHIRYLMKYEPQAEQLIVIVRSCSNLPQNNDTSTLDPYVLIRAGLKKPGSRTLEPIGDEPPVRSEPVRNSLDPVFNCQGIFRIKRDQLSRAAVLLEIYDWNSANQHTMVARHKHSIQDTTEGHQIDDILTSDFASFEGTLKRGHRTPNTGPGDICVLLERGLQNEPLKVTIIECKRVYLTDSEGKVDESTIPNLYVGVKLIEPQGRVHTRRTRTVHRSRNPYFNEAFHFNVAPEKLYRCGLRLSLVHVSDILRIRRTVGILELSKEEEEDNKLAQEHWMAIAQQPEAGDNNGTRRKLQPSRAARCSWHYLVTPEEMAKLLAARAARKQKRQQQKLQKAAAKEVPEVNGLD